MVRAMKSGVWEEYPDARVIFAGAERMVDGAPARPHLRNLAGSRADQLVFAGALASDVLFPTVSAADLVVTPSLWEAFGIATLEAMALGKRVVATDGSGYAEFCRDGVNSILVAPNSPASLADGILRALESKASVLGENAMATADEFDSAVRAAEYRDWLISAANLP
jgi:glycosyltransferase involved in cell wall biosynthesis